MNRFTSALYFVFIASLLAAGCTAPSFLMNPPEPSPPSPEEKTQQTLESLESWNGERISKVIREWGSPHGISDDDAGSKIYIWRMQLPAQTLPRRQEHRFLSRPDTSNPLRVIETSSSTDDIYELMFYTDAKGVIYKTVAKRDENPSVGSRSLGVFEEKPRTTR